MIYHILTIEKVHLKNCNNTLVSTILLNVYNDIIKYCFDDGRSVQIFNLNYAILSFHASAIYCNSLFN